MANRSDNAPKSFREVPCARCGNNFKSSGPNHKRCDPCKVEHKREYEREKKRAKHTRKAACFDCKASFPSDVHSHRVRCTECARVFKYRRDLAANNIRSKQRRLSDPAFRLHGNVATLIRRCLNGSKQHRSWEDLLGFTTETLKQHLEKQFIKGMTWGNYGSHWHVDHIIPRALFFFDTAEHPDFRACWALSNLRPLWATDNLKKNAKRLHLL